LEQHRKIPPVSVGFQINVVLALNEQTETNKTEIKIG